MLLLYTSELYGLLQLGLTENDILKFAETYLNLLNRTYSAEDLAKGMIKAIDIMTTTTTSHIMKTTSNDKLRGILSRVRQDLSHLDELLIKLFWELNV